MGQRRNMSTAIRVAIALVSTLLVIAPTGALGAPGDPHTSFGAGGATTSNLGMGSQQRSTGSSRCTAESFEVKLAEHDPTTQTIAASLCTKPGNRTLLITVHGMTYNRMYWDWPQDPSTYSFLQNQSHRVSVLNLDRLGAGESDRPASGLVNVTTQAYAVHQVVQSMRARGFQNVILVAHSLGSGIALVEAATYHDVDGLVLTGFLHSLVQGGRDALMSLLYPATLDQRFAHLLLDPGYITTRPGDRSVFYNTAIADPAVLAYDEAHKDVDTATDFAQFLSVVIGDAKLPRTEISVGATIDRSFARQVDVPVLSLVGQYDSLFCDPPDCPQARREPDVWRPAAQLELHVIPDAGHNIHLHAEPAQIEFRYISEWLHRRFGGALTHSQVSP